MSYTYNGLLYKETSLLCDMMEDVVINEKWINIYNAADY